MMYLTRVELDGRNRKTQVALEKPSMFHGAVERAFEPRQKRVLWRIDQLGGVYYLLILSDSKPNNIINLVRQFCRSSADVATKSYEPLLNKAEKDTIWRFRLVANPTYSVPLHNTKPVRNPIAAHITEEGQLEWLKKRSEQYGFTIVDDACRITASEWKVFKKNKDADAPINMLLVSYEGILKVTDTSAFRTMLCSGIGREKAYGAGMLTICR